MDGARLVSPVLIARDRELAAFDAAFKRITAGQPAVVVIGGEAGIGKTRLVEEATSRAAAAGATVLIGACLELGGDGMPLAPLVDALRILVATMSAAALDVVLGPARRELARLLPELDPSVLDGPAPAPDAAAVSRLFELVLGLVRRLAAERPLVLVIEDLHWADESTRDLVAFLARTMRGGRVMLVLTFRTDEIHRRHPLRPLVAELDRLRWTTTLQLERFSHEEVDEQVQAILRRPPPHDLIADIYERSEGNAFLVEELAAMLESERATLSASLRDLLLTRVEKLPDDAQHVVRIAAAAGRRVDHRLLANVAEIDTVPLQAALRAAVEHHVLTADDAGRGYAFRHALVREAVYDDILPGEIVGIHTAYATALEHSPDLAATAAAAASEISHHWHAAHNVTKALTSSIAAGRQALATYGFAEAERQLLRALELWPLVPDAPALTGVDHVELLALAVDSLAAAAHEQRAMTFLDEALNELDEDADRERVALLLIRRADLELWAGRRKSTTTLQRAVDLLPAEPATRVRATALEKLAQSNLLMGSFDEGRSLAEAAVTAARAVGATLEAANALITLGCCLAYTGGPTGAISAIEEALAVARENHDEPAILRGIINLADILTLLGRNEEAVRVATEGLQLARDRGQMSGMGAFLAGNAAEPLIRLGRWDEAERVIADTLQVDVSGMSAVLLYQLQAEIEIGRGRWSHAADWLAQAGAIHIEDEWGQFRLPLAYIEAELLRGGGAPERAVAVAAEVLGERAPEDDARYAWPLLWAGLRSAADVRAAPVAARALSIDLEKMVSSFIELASTLRADNPTSVALARLCTAEAARWKGEADSDHWQQAVDASRSAGDPQLLSYALVRLGDVLVDEHRRQDASLAVAEAIDIASRIGARPIEEAARSFARRARLGPVADLDEAATAESTAAAGTVGPAGVSADAVALTQREVDVLQLVADGLRNSQIAAALYISPKTVSVHVSNILAKFGVSTRGEAAAVAHRAGLFGSKPV